MPSNIWSHMKYLIYDFLVIYQLPMFFLWRKLFAHVYSVLASFDLQKKVYFQQNELLRTFVVQLKQYCRSEMKISNLVLMVTFWTSSAKVWNTLYFKQVKCVLPPESFYQNYSCFAKSMNRTFSTFTVVFEAIQPMDVIYVSSKFLFFYRKKFYFLL